MENALKALMIAAETVLTCIIIAFGFYAADAAKTSAAAGSEAAAGYERRLTENSYLIYDGATLSGSELLNLIRYEMSMTENGRGSIAFFEVTVKNKVTISGRDDIAKVTEEKSADRISPYAAFKGEAVWKQGLLVGLRFTPVKQ